MARITAGAVLIVVGVAGLVLPILPGWLPIIGGLTLWSTELEWAAVLRRWASSRLRGHRNEPPCSVDATGPRSLGRGPDP